MTEQPTYFDKYKLIKEYDDSFDKIYDKPLLLVSGIIFGLACGFLILYAKSFISDSSVIFLIAGTLMLLQAISNIHKANIIKSRLGEKKWVGPWEQQLMK
ncbi:hypothetical protein [uncultured Microscilla sp.]|uniref:hypothetical protein n=1 Tax=uncultured Microscilla sp. TaxID=432653 RepID=UPI002628BFD1|nr:hypothetical protein [uncultured Microscilla sp.]